MRNASPIWSSHQPAHRIPPVRGSSRPGSPLAPHFAVALLVTIGIILLRAGIAAADTGIETHLGEQLKQVLNRPGHGLGWAYALSFVAGLATSLTPCVYPLIPITVSLFGARDSQTNRFQALGLAACYVGGLATMYSGLGVSVALAGGQFGTFMASPYYMVPVASFFLLMAASMFGAFEMALPSELQGRLSRVGGKGPLGAYLMGLVAGIIAAPCTGPPLAALLLFVSTQKSVFLGGSLLFVYALGMGVLFFAIAGFALRMPKSGAWMDAVKTGFGVIMIVAALYFLRNVLPPLGRYGQTSTKSFAIHGALAIVGILIGALHLSFHDGPARVARKGVGVALLTFGLFGILASILAVPAPLISAEGKSLALPWLDSEPVALGRARAEHKPLLIDFGANWCLPCKEMERKTFSSPAIQAELGRFVLLRIDCSVDTDEISAIKSKYDSDTLPSVVMFDSSGQKALKLSEFTSAEKLLPALQKIR